MSKLKEVLYVRVTTDRVNVTVVFSKSWLGLGLTLATGLLYVFGL